MSDTPQQDTPKPAKLDTATLGGGCFWCVEAVMQRLKGVHGVQSGYAGGHVKNPSYRDVTTGETGHAEVVQVTYDPELISYPELLYVFFRTHNPTTLNRQGNDVGTQYRSVIMPHNEEQARQARQAIAETNEAQVWDDPVVTTVEPLETFYPAEDYHQNYYNQNRNQPYCTFVIDPKVQKLQKNFGDKLKEDAN